MTKGNVLVLCVLALALVTCVYAFTPNGQSDQTVPSAAEAKTGGACGCCPEKVKEVKDTACCAEKTCPEACPETCPVEKTGCRCGENCKCCEGCSTGGTCTCEECKCCENCAK